MRMSERVGITTNVCSFILKKRARTIASWVRVRRKKQRMHTAIYGILREYAPDYKVQDIVI